MAKVRNPGPVGQRLRELREQNGWTLVDVTQRTGISKATLSKIENGQTKLSFTTVNKLAEGLGLPITAFTAPQNQLPSPQQALTRLGGGTVFETRIGVYEILCDDLAGNHQTFMRIRVTSQSVDDEVDWHRHPGQEFLFVLSGTLILHMQGQQPTRLNSGDCIVFDASVGHKYVAAGDTETELLITMQASGYTDIEDQVE